MSWVYLCEDTAELCYQIYDDSIPEPTPVGQKLLRVGAALLWLLNAFDIPFKLWAG